MAFRRRYSRRFGIELAVAAFAFGGLAVLVLGAACLSCRLQTTSDDDDMRDRSQSSGCWLLPAAKHSIHGYRTFNRSWTSCFPRTGLSCSTPEASAVVDGESVTCNLGNGYFLTTTLVKWLDENGKVELRCELFHDKAVEFSTLVKTPSSQLFFCQRALDDGSQLLIGVGAR